MAQFGGVLPLHYGIDVFDLWFYVFRTRIWTCWEIWSRFSDIAYIDRTSLKSPHKLCFCLCMAYNTCLFWSIHGSWSERSRQALCQRHLPGGLGPDDAFETLQCLLSHKTLEWHSDGIRQERSTAGEASRNWQARSPRNWNVDFTSKYDLQQSANKFCKSRRIKCRLAFSIAYCLLTTTAGTVQFRPQAIKIQVFGLFL